MICYFNIYFSELLVHVSDSMTIFCNFRHFFESGLIYIFKMQTFLNINFAIFRVAVVGNVDAGKSTLLGVLTHTELDNGRGYARQKLFRHKHEMESGRTSSVGNDILGFDSQGNIVNKPEHGNLDWVRICEKSSKVCVLYMTQLSS